MSDSFRNFKRIDEILRRIFENPDNFDEKFEVIFKTKILSSPSENKVKINFVYVSDNTLDENNGQNLEKELQDAIDSENFERAIEIRDEIKRLETNKDEINKLESELRKSIEEQVFEKWIVLRNQINKL